MIISKTPFRISLVGGGSDLKNFYKDYPGAVVSTSIDKYIYLSIHKYFNNSSSLIKYSQTELIDNVNDIKHNIIREVFKYFDISNVDFNSTADIPSGTGMGSSSSFTCGLIQLCSFKNGLILPKYEIAKLACKIEIDILGGPIGKQDQYGCAIGGLNLIQFNPDESVNVMPIHLSDNDAKKLNSNLLLFYTNKRRSASSVLNEQKRNTTSSSKVRNNLKDLAQMAHQLFKELSSGNIDSVGEFLDVSWKKKKELASKVSNHEIDKIYNIAMNNGASGGKILGAGGGGFLLFYVPLSKQRKLRKSLNFLREFEFNFDQDGTQIIYSK